MQAFRGSMIFTVVCLLLAGVLGYVETGLVGPALSMVFIAALCGTSTPLGWPVEPDVKITYAIWPVSGKTGAANGSG